MPDVLWINLFATLIEEGYSKSVIAKLGCFFLFISIYSQDYSSILEKKYEKRAITHKLVDIKEHVEMFSLKIS